MIIQDRINKMLNELGVNDVSAEEKLELTQHLIDHFNKIITETLIINLDDDQLKKFKEYSDKDSEADLDAHISELAASIPGLQFKIEDAIQTEFENLRSAKQVLDK